MCTIPFEIWRGFFILIIKREKGLELMKIILITHLSAFGSKVLLTLKIMDFENLLIYM
jgi:hypothetical protein